MALLLHLTQKLQQGFSAFWVRWPRKQARKDANKAWDSLKPSPELEEEIHKALDWQIPLFEQREPQYIPLAATWIRGERWTDQPMAPPKPKVVTPQLPAWQVAQMEQTLEQARKTKEVHRLIAEGMDRAEAFDRVWNQKTTRNRDTTE